MRLAGLATTLAAGLALLAPATARAGELTGIGGLFAGIEVLIPDVRFEIPWGWEDARWTLSWPLTVRSGTVDLGDTVRIGFSHFGEVQYGLDQRSLRGLLGERLMLGSAEDDDGWMPVAEVAGLLGADGSGVVLGVGFGFGAMDAGIHFGPVVRAVITTEERRFDLVLDLQIPFNVDD